MLAFFIPESCCDEEGVAIKPLDKPSENPIVDAVPPLRDSRTPVR